MTRRKKLLVLVIVIAAAVGASWYQFGGHRTAEGQRPLADLSTGSLDQFRTDFNAAAGETRMILLLSPT